MKKLLLFLGFYLSVSCAAFAQFTSVTATITDSDSQTWNNGKWSATLYNPFPANPPSIGGVPLTNAQLNLSGALSNSGVLTATMADNQQVAPTGTQWQFTICPNASTQCSTMMTPVTGASEDISTIINPQLRQLRFPASPTAYGYLDGEVSPIPLPGGQYFNVTNLVSRVWNGTAWQNGGGGGGNSSDTRPTQTTTVKALDLPPGGTVTISSIASGPGTLTSIHLSSFGFDYKAITLSTINFTCGNTTQSVPLYGLFATVGLPTPFGNGSGQFEEALMDISSGGYIGGWGRALDINFTSGCLVTMTDADSLGAGQSIYADLTYKIGPQIDPPTKNKWFAHSAVTTFGGSGTLSLLPTVTASGGELEAITLAVIPASSDFNYLEAEPTVTTDGNIAVTANGTEDFFGNSFYCDSPNTGYENVGGIRDDKWGCSIGLQLQYPYSPVTIWTSNFYRFFTTNSGNNVFFTHTLSASWPVGEALTTYSTVFYWTE